MDLSKILLIFKKRFKVRSSPIDRFYVN